MLGFGSTGPNPTSPENRHVVTINPGRSKGSSYVGEVLSCLRSYVRRSCVVGGLMLGGFMLGGLMLGGLMLGGLML